MLMVVCDVMIEEETKKKKGERERLRLRMEGRKSKDQWSWSVRGLCSFLWNAVEIHFYRLARQEITITIVSLIRAVKVST
jgi:hypothetical protein